MGILILGALLLALAISGLVTLIGVYLLIRQRRMASVWQILASIVGAVVCLFVFMRAVDFSAWMARLDNLPSSEAAAHYIPMAFMVGLAPATAISGFVAAWSTLNWLIRKRPADCSTRAPIRLTGGCGVYWRGVGNSRALWERGTEGLTGRTPIGARHFRSFAIARLRQLCPGATRVRCL